MNKGQLVEAVQKKLGKDTPKQQLTQHLMLLLIASLQV